MATEFTLRFDGLDAVHHRVDMRLLGRAMLGAEAAIHDGYWLAIERSADRGRKRTELSVQVYAPRAKCYELQGAIFGAAGVLPFAYEVATSLGADYVKHLLSAILLYHGGRRSDAASHMDKALDIIREQNASTERMHAVTMDTMLKLVEGSRRAATDIVAPVGPSVNRLQIGTSDMEDATDIDVAMADAIRSTQPVQVSDMVDVSVRFDALLRASRKAKVYLDEAGDKPVSAEIRDPAYDEFPNLYSEAFHQDHPLMVSAKISRRDDGEIVKLHIMDAKQGS